MSDIDEDDIPDRKTCDRLCKEFAGITNTDTACAQFFLQDTKWDLQTSLAAYFETKRSSDDTEDESNNKESESDDEDVKEVEQVANAHNLKLISWNIDGLNENTVIKRTESVCQTIIGEQADVVFLQEITNETLTIIEKHLKQTYQIYQGNDQGYYTLILTKKKTINCDDYQVIPFPTSAMGRNLLVVKGKIGDSSVLLITSHLESTKEHAKERKKQLKTIFKYALENKEENETVILGGDFNLRDDELADAGGIPSRLEDLWISCGSRPECRYTWDMTRNDNLQFSGRVKPRLRFDRLYMARSNPPKIIPQHFGLIGLERVKGCRRFPSDHWGLVVIFILN